MGQEIGFYSTKVSGATRNLYTKEWIWSYQNNCKWVIEVNIRAITVILLKENRTNYYDNVLFNGFLDMTLKAQVTTFLKN